MYTDKTDKQQLIKELKTRLDWYTLEASEQEFDAEEVEALVKLIHVLGGERENVMLKGEQINQVPDFKQFEEYMARKQAAQEKIIAQESVLEQKSVDKKEKNMSTKAGKKVFSGKRRFVAVAVAAIAVIVLAGGTIGVVSAHKAGGFFNWLKRDETGEQIVILPQGDEENALSEVRYYSENEVPKEKQGYLIGIEEFESLKSYELEYIDVGEFINCIQIQYYYKQVNQKQAIITVSHYQDKLMLKQENYDDYEYLKEELVGEEQLSFFSRENNQGEKAYLISFYHGSSHYLISGTYSLEVMEQIAKECVEKTKN